MQGAPRNPGEDEPDRDSTAERDSEDAAEDSQDTPKPRGALCEAPRET